jgi:hypothetical protein
MFVYCTDAIDRVRTFFIYCLKKRIETELDYNGHQS